MVSNSYFVRPSIYYYHKPANLKDYRLFLTLSSQFFQSEKNLASQVYALVRKDLLQKFQEGIFDLLIFPNASHLTNPKGSLFRGVTLS